MNKKRNKNGFTLVELIVVLCIFGMIMGCILNFMKPANEVHDDVQATMDANVISSGLIEYVDDEIRYATNVLVLYDYAGVPKVSSSGVVGEGICPVSFTNCLIIDNCNPRGYLTKDYASNEKNSTATKIGATGCVYKMTKVASEGFNLNNAKVVKGSDFYDKFKFEISAKGHVEDGVDTSAMTDEEKAEKAEIDSNVSVVEFNVTTYSPTYKGGKYVFERKKFTRDSDDGATAKKKDKHTGAVINLTNININPKDTNYLLYEADGNTVTNVPNAAAPAGSTAEQKNLYNKDRKLTMWKDGKEYSDVQARYTYIFYEKAQSMNADSCTVTFTYATDCPTESLRGQLVGSNGKQTVSKGYTLKIFPSDYQKIPGYSSVTWSVNGKAIDTSKGITITKNTNITLNYNADPGSGSSTGGGSSSGGSSSGGGSTSTEKYTVTWKGIGGAADKVAKDVPAGVLASSGDSYMGAPNGLDEDNYVYDDYYLEGTNQSYTSTIVDKDLVFVPQIRQKFTVSFKYSGTTKTLSFKVPKGDLVDPVHCPAVTAPSGQELECWHVEGHEDQIITSHGITANTVFVPKFKTASSSGGSSSGSASLNSPSVGSEGSDYNGWGRFYEITINNSGDTVGKWKVVIEFGSSGDVSFSQFIAGNGQLGNSVSGNKLTVTSPSWMNLNIPKNGSYTFSFVLGNSAANKIKSISVTPA